MNLRNMIKKAAIVSQLGSLAASTVLSGHDQKKNEAITEKVNKVFAGLYELSGGDEEF